MNSITGSQADKSYRALLAVPLVGRLLLGMQIARIAQSMVSVTVVLFALGAYGSPAVAGAATFFSIFPGLVVSPIAGALLDRHGRSRLVVLDYVMALGSLALIGTLALADILPAWLLIVIAGVASLTAPLSATGLRSLFPLIVPNHLWERVNAIDSTGYVVAAIVGPPLAAGLVALWGGPMTFIIIGICYGFAAVVIARAPDPPTKTVSTGRLIADAWQGVIYTSRNPTLRGLAFSISVLNLANGAFTIIVPVLILDRFRFGETMVGMVFAIQGLTGVISAFIFGRHDTRNRERMLAAVPMALTGVAIALLLLRPTLIALALVMAITGLLNGPIDIALFTLRQRRTDISWAGRAYAVSMAFNYSGAPIGSVLAGYLVSRSLEATIALVALTSLISGVLAGFMIPPREWSD
jgi:MFS family permease